MPEPVAVPGRPAHARPEGRPPDGARRAELAADRAYLRDVLAAGNERANAVADRTLDEVKRAMAM